MSPPTQGTEIQQTPRCERALTMLERCARALRDLANESEPEEGKDGSLGVAIPALVGLLHAGPAAAADAAWALASLTSVSQSPQWAPNNLATIAAVGGVQPLVTMLEEYDDTKASAAAASALHNLASHTPVTADAVLMAVVNRRPSGTDITGPLLTSRHPYLVRRLRPAAARRLKRAEAAGPNALRAAIDDADKMGAERAALADARSRLRELEAEFTATARPDQCDVETLGPDGVGLILLPPDFCCPITCERMVDPVVASDGHSYERAAIMEVLGPTGTRLSPLTREPLEIVTLPNTTLLKRIRGYEEEVVRVAERVAATVRSQLTGGFDPTPLLRTTKLVYV